MKSKQTTNKIAIDNF